MASGRGILYEPYAEQESIRRNVDAHARADMSPRIIRRAESKGCPWCRSLAGTHDYPVDREVYQRHENCRCTVLYDPADGKRRRQNVHTKEWTDAEKYDSLKKKKPLAMELAEHPARLASFTPERLMMAFESEGMEVKPLMKGHLKGVSFEDGGGFKVNFEDGGLFQYHPATFSHHSGAYYKISTGKGGTKRYGLDGTEKSDEKSKD